MPTAQLPFYWEICVVSMSRHHNILKQNALILKEFQEN